MINAPALAVFGFGGSESLVLLALLVLFSVLPFWMIVDCATKEEESGNKIAWLLIILLAGFIGAPLYFFVRKLPRKRR